MMERNIFIKSKILPLLALYQFDVRNEYKNFVEFSNDIYCVSIGFNEYEKSNTFSMGRVNEQQISINEQILKLIFNFNIKIDNLCFNDFVENVVIILKSISSKIFEQNSKIIDDLKNFAYLAAKIYTQKIINTQYIKIADKVWKEKDYSKFVSTFEKLNIDLLSKSYLMKYDFAVKQLKKE